MNCWVDILGRESRDIRYISVVSTCKSKILVFAVGSEVCSKVRYEQKHHKSDQYKRENSPGLAPVI